MFMFYIKWIKITANQKESRIDFAPGLNIIYGPSNTGKSMVLDCIDYSNFAVANPLIYS